MAVTPESAIETLEEALAGGVTEVTFADGRRVKYNSGTELREALAYFRAQARAAANQGAVGVSVGAFHRD